MSDKSQIQSLQVEEDKLQQTSWWLSFTVIAYIHHGFYPYTPMCVQHCILSIYPSSVNKITGILLGWDSNPGPLHFQSSGKGHVFESHPSNMHVSFFHRTRVSTEYTVLNTHRCIWVKTTMNILYPGCKFYIY